MATIFRVSAPVHPGTSPAGNVSALEYPITIGANKTVGGGRRQNRAGK